MQVFEKKITYYHGQMTVDVPPDHTQRPDLLPVLSVSPSAELSWPATWVRRSSTLPLPQHLHPRTNFSFQGWVKSIGPQEKPVDC